MNTLELRNCGSWNSGDVFSISFVGSREFVKKQVDNLEENFNEPKFGYVGELWDESDG